MSIRHVAGAILAGGRAQRLGGLVKPLLEVDGEPLVARVVRTMNDALGADAAIFVAVHDDAQHDAIAAALAASGAHAELVRDVEAGGGPLSGLVACLEAAAGHGAATVVLVAADMPYVPASWIARLAERRPDAAALITMGDRREPLCARYAVTLAALGRARLAGANRSMMGFVDAAGAETLVFDAGPTRALTDVDTPDDAARLGIDLTGPIRARE